MSEVNSPYIPFTYNPILNRSLGIILLFFLIWPFGAFLYALYNYDRRESRIVLVLFTALLAYSMIPVSKGLDLYRVLHEFPNYSHLSYSDFKDSLTNLYSNTESESVDLYRDTVTFLVSRFTENGNWLMLVFGLVTGFVYTKVLSLFISESPGRNLHKYILIISFSFIIAIDQISGVRFCLAAYVFFYGAINVILYGDKRYLIVAASSVLIHFSFLSVVLLLIIFLKLKNYPRIIYLLLVLSFILPNLLHSYIIQYSGIFGQGIESRTELYSTLESDLKIGSDTSWYVKFRIILMLIFSYFTLFVTRIKKKDLNYSSNLNDLFFFLLVILSFVNFTMNIPHFGYRFQFVFLMLAIYYLYKVYADNSESLLMSRLVLFSFPFSSLMIAYGLRSTLYITPFTLYCFNLPSIFLYQPAHTIWLDFFN